jgi:hypothetical protein
LRKSKRDFLITGIGIIKDAGRGSFNPGFEEWKRPEVGSQADGVAAVKMSDNGIYWSFRDYKSPTIC